MSQIFTEQRLLSNHETDPTQIVLGDLASALHGIAAAYVSETVDLRGLSLEQREVLCLTAARELLHQLQSSLTAAPQSPLTSEILEPLSQAGAFAKQQIDVRFPETKTEEKQLAALIVAVRANIRTGKRGKF
jgi:hypothetical protein